MITTVTLNPAIDRTLFLESFRENHVNRVTGVKTYPGGKGINASKIIQLLGAENVASGIAAGRNGRFIEEELKHTGIRTDFIWVTGETRINTKIYDIAKGYTTDLNEPGPCIDGKGLEALKEKIELLAAECSVMVFAGSIPVGLPAGIYRELAEIAAGKGSKVILDCDGESLEEGIKAKPHMIKPNVHELEMILGRRLDGDSDLIQAAEKLAGGGIDTVVVSMGARGAFMVRKDAVHFAESIPVEVKGTVGAGDSMVGAFAFTLDRGGTPEKGLVLAISASTACVRAGSASDVDRAALVEFIDRVPIKKIK